MLQELEAEKTKDEVSEAEAGGFDCPESEAYHGKRRQMWAHLMAILQAPRTDDGARPADVGAAPPTSTGTAAPEKLCRCGLVVGCSAPELHAEGCEELERLRAKHAPPASTSIALKEPVCETCHDTHVLPSTPHWMCTRCPLPCAKCARGAFCATTPCTCECHKHPDLKGTAPSPVTAYCSPRVEERAAALSGPRVLGREELLRCPVGYLEMSVRAANALQLAGVATVAELVAMTQGQVSKLRNMDDRAAARLVEDLAVYGLALADAPTPAADPLCARDLGSGRKCWHPLSRHAPVCTVSGWGINGGLPCPCPGFVPPEPPPRLTDALRRVAAALMAVTQPAPENGAGTDPGVENPELRGPAQRALMRCARPGCGRLWKEHEFLGPARADTLPDDPLGYRCPAFVVLEPSVVVDHGTARTCETCAHYDPDTVRPCPFSLPAQNPCGMWSPKSGGSSTEGGETR